VEIVRFAEGFGDGVEVFQFGSVCDVADGGVDVVVEVEELLDGV